MDRQTIAEAILYIHAYKITAYNHRMHRVSKQIKPYQVVEVSCLFSTHHCTRAVIRIPTINANPFAIPPAYFTTRPTIMPPNAYTKSNAESLNKHSWLRYTHVTYLHWRVLEWQHEQTNPQ